MTWLPILALAAFAFIFAVFALRLPRHAWMLFGAALLFGLAGYALQGSPGQPSAPAPSRIDDQAQTGALLVDARREFYGAGLPSRFVVTADAFARRGQFEQAANFLRNAVDENPSDGEAWLALGNALVEHAEGRLTDAALYAFSRAEEAQPDNPAPTYFLGLALLRGGQAEQARAMWAQLLASAPEDAEWREPLRLRLEKLDQLLGMSTSSKSPETER